MARSIEEICVMRIENGIRGIKMGPRKIQEVYTDIEYSLKKLRSTNESLADDLENQLMVVRMKAEARVAV